MRQIVPILLVAAMVLLIAGCGSDAESKPAAGAPSAAAVSPPNPDDPTVVFAVEGMTCQGCVDAISSTVAQIPGVTGVSVSLDEKRATVSCSQPNEQTRAAIASAIDNLGYTATAQ